MGIDHFLRQLRDGELDSESSEDEPEEEEEPQGKISRFHAICWFMMVKNDQTPRRVSRFKIMPFKAMLNYPIVFETNYISM